MSLKFPISLVGKRGSPPETSYLGGSATPQSVNVQTYADFDIGEPDPNRIILIQIGGRYSGSSWSGAGVKVNGISATLVTRTGFGFFTGVALYKISVPTGTTANIEITKPSGSTSSINGFQAYRVIGNDISLVASDQDSCGFYDWQCGDVATGLVTTVNTIPNGVVLALGYWRFSYDARFGGLTWTGIEQDGYVAQNGMTLASASLISDGSEVTVSAQTNIDNSDGKRLLLVCLEIS